MKEMIIGNDYNVVIKNFGQMESTILNGQKIPL